MPSFNFMLDYGDRGRLINSCEMNGLEGFVGAVSVSSIVNERCGYCEQFFKYLYIRS